MYQYSLQIFKIPLFSMNHDKSSKMCIALKFQSLDSKMAGSPSKNWENVSSVSITTVEIQLLRVWKLNTSLQNYASLKLSFHHDRFHLHQTTVNMLRKLNIIFTKYSQFKKIILKRIFNILCPWRLVNCKYCCDLYPYPKQA